MSIEIGAEALIAAIGIEIGKLVFKLLKNKKQDEDPKWTTTRRKKTGRKK